MREHRTRRNGLLGGLLVCGLVAAGLVACGGGDGDGSSGSDTQANGSGSDSAPKPKPYRRPRLTRAEIGETLYYPLDTCVVSGKKLLPNCHAEGIPDPAKGGKKRLLMLYNQHQVAEAKKNSAKYFAMVDKAYKDQQRAGYLELIKECPVTGEALGEGSYEFLLDPRDEYVQVLDTMMKYLVYRYTVSWRLVIVKDEAAAKEFQRLDTQVVNKQRNVTRKICPVGAKAIDKVNQAMIKKQFPEFKKRFTDKAGKIMCFVNGRPLGRVQEDPDTGGYRMYLHHTLLMVVCCKSCMRDIRTGFEFQLLGMSRWTGKAPKEISLLAEKRIPPPPN